MLIVLPYAVGEQVMYVPVDSDAEDDSHEATVIENALPDAKEVEIFIDGEDEPRSVSAECIVREISRFKSSD